MESILRPRNISVKDFMTKHVQTISSHSTMEQAIQKMTMENVESLIVTGEQLELKGVLSERDMVSKLVQMHRDPVRTLVSEVMTGEIVKLTPDQSLREAAELMNSKRNRLLVFENNQLHGIITATDIVKAIYDMHYAFDISRANKEIRLYSEE